MKTYNEDWSTGGSSADPGAEARASAERGPDTAAAESPAEPTTSDKLIWIALSGLGSMLLLWYAEELAGPPLAAGALAVLAMLWPTGAGRRGGRSPQAGHPRGRSRPRAPRRATTGPWPARWPPRGPGRTRRGSRWGCGSAPRGQRAAPASGHGPDREGPRSGRQSARRS